MNGDAEGETGDRTLIPSVSFSECPIKLCAGILGKKWTMLILRDIGIRNIQRFNRLLESIPGITPRMLSMRLRELEQGGYIERLERSNVLVRWTLTEKGGDTLPILMSFIAFGSKWHAGKVFADKTPRTLKELYPGPRAREVIEKYTRA
jgi:DNA-binding HxlR family transcriptional regulator